MRRFVPKAWGLLCSFYVRVVRFERMIKHLWLCELKRSPAICNTTWQGTVVAQSGTLGKACRLVRQVC